MTEVANATSQLDILVVAPHPDDAEIGVAGTLLQSKASGLAVGVIDLTSGEPTPHGSLETRAKETAAATQVLRLDWRQNLNLPNRSLEATLSARRALAEVFRTLRPKIIFAPYWEDVHPDHIAASQLVDAARFWSKLSKSDLAGQPYWPPKMYYYFSIHLRIHPRPSFVIDISQHIEPKMQAIGCYESQFVTGRPSDFPTPLDDIRDRSRYWGWSIGVRYGEPFVSREEIGLTGLDALI
ncbi:MAG TPA: bacillithiol biosynthesis deacetylase BshB1 [Planctomycetaceae bacterium]|nr:bacillithiol biosynthesis deacetylase BshB1 [Planctomycetaceae bacterium]